jgi:hypothetical protein
MNGTWVATTVSVLRALSGDGRLWAVLIGVTMLVSLTGLAWFAILTRRNTNPTMQS